MCWLPLTRDKKRICGVLIKNGCVKLEIKELHNLCVHKCFAETFKIFLAWILNYTPKPVHKQLANRKKWIQSQTFLRDSTKSLYRLTYFSKISSRQWTRVSITLTQMNEVLHWQMTLTLTSQTKFRKKNPIFVC